MKVNDVKEVGALRDVSAAKPTRSPGQTDKVSTSQTQDAAGAIEVAKASSGMSRSERLRQLEQQVRSGTYTPNVAQIADQILDDAELSARLQAMLK